MLLTGPYRSTGFPSVGSFAGAFACARAASVSLDLAAKGSFDLILFAARVPVDQGSRRPATSRLQHLAVGDSIVVGHKATGTLLIANVRPGRNFYMFRTGTGLAPFMSLIRVPETFERYERVVLVHGCRQTGELAYKTRSPSNLRRTSISASCFPRG